MSESDDDCQIISDQPQVSSDLSDPSVKQMNFEEDEENQESASESATLEAEASSIEYYTVSHTNPRFDVILSYSHLNRPHYLTIPAKINSTLPREKVPVVLKSNGKCWSMFYNGHKRAKVLELKGWRKFAADNELKLGDCCVFELMEASRKRIEFRVVIIKTDPSFWAAQPIIL